MRICVWEAFVFQMLYFVLFFFFLSRRFTAGLRACSARWASMASLSFFFSAFFCRMAPVKMELSIIGRLSPSPERRRQSSASDWNNDFCCHTWAFVWSVCVDSAFTLLIKFILRFWKELKGGTQMVEIIELIEYSAAASGHLDPVIWVKCFF